MNSSIVLARHLQQLDPGAPVFVIGEPPLIGELRDHGFEVRSDAEVRWVVIAFDRTFDYAKLNTALQAVRRHDARLIATNPDRTCPVEGGEIPGLRRHDGGRGGRDQQAGRGRRRQAVAHHLARSRSRRSASTAADCVIVGDRLETDIVMGKRLGLATVLVLSGVTRPDDPRIAELRPDLVLPSVHALLR